MLEALWTTLGTSDVAVALRSSRWLAAAADRGQVLGIALFVGALLPLDLRLLGLWRWGARETAFRILAPVAATGLALAMVCGLLLFAARPADGAALPLFALVLALIALGLASALLARWRRGWRLAGAATGAAGHCTTMTLFCWLGALAAGRLLALAGP